MMSDRCDFTQKILLSGRDHSNLMNETFNFARIEEGQLKVDLNAMDIKPLSNERLASSKNVEGIGIGLALSKGLIESMGGQIGVYSEIGKGSTFWVMFPVFRSEAIPS